VSLPLEGYTVVAVEQAVAVPLASRQLADMGARVIKIERPGEGDLARGYDHLVHGTGSHFVWLNRGKESLAVDLKDPAGRDVVRRLISGPTSSCRTSLPELQPASGWMQTPCDAISPSWSW